MKEACECLVKIVEEEKGTLVLLILHKKDIKYFNVNRFTLYKKYDINII